MASKNGLEADMISTTLVSDMVMTDSEEEVVFFSLPELPEGPDNPDQGASPPLRRSTDEEEEIDIREGRSGLSTWKCQFSYDH